MTFPRAQIRPATPADIPQMMLLAQQAETAAHWSEREYDALFSPETPKRVALLADDGGRLSGFLIARADFGEWEIENVVVDPERRRSGVGSALVQEVLHQAAAAKATSVLLEVRQSNAAARGLYEKLGFQQVGVRRGYYAQPVEDALLLKFSVSFR